MKMNRIGWIVLAGMIAASAGSFSEAASPVFFDTSPETTIVDLNAGQTSFEVTGFVRDRDVNDTVSFLEPFGVEPFMTFEGTPGNPASFRIYANNLTGLQYGGYRVDVIAVDNGVPFSSATSFSFGIGVLPEPMGLSFGFLLLLVRRSRS